MGILDYLPGRSNSSISNSNAYHENPTRSSDGAYIAPDRSTREKCYEARDTFFACLEQHGIVDSLKRKDEAEKVCGEEDRALAKECAASWVHYFKKRRVMEVSKKNTLEQLSKEGAEPIPGELPQSAMQRPPR